MIEENRELQVPGDGIVRDPGPAKEHLEFPRYMTHDSFRAARLDKEIGVKDEAGRQVGSYYTGAEAQRFAPVLAMTPAQREEHLSYGYKDNGKLDPAAFQRAVSAAAPSTEVYKPIEYPKYHFGRTVFSRAEEEDHLIELNINADGSPRTAASSEAPSNEPALDTEVNTLEIVSYVERMNPPGATTTADVLPVPSEEDSIEALEAKLAALKAKKERAAQLKAEIAKLETEEPATAAEITQAVAAEVDQAPVDDAGAAMRAERARKMREGKARKKAEREAAQAQDGSKAA